MNSRVIASGPGLTPGTLRIPEANGMKALTCYFNVLGGYAQAVFIEPTRVSPCRYPINLSLASTVEFDGQNMWQPENLSKPNYRLGVHQFAINGMPPTTLSNVGVTQWGDIHTHWGQIILDGSGGLTFFYHSEFTLVRIDPNTGQKIYEAEFFVVFKPRGGAWGTPVRVLINTHGVGAVNSHECACLHPVDGSAWCFIKGDGWAFISGIRSVNGGVTVYPEVITSRTGGNPDPNGPHGENCQPVAVADPANSRILLTCQRNDASYKNGVFSAGLGFWGISAAGQSTVLPLPDVRIERISHHGLALVDGAPTICYQPVYAAPMTGDTYLKRFTGGGWSAAEYVDKAALTGIQNWIAYGNACFAYQRPNTEIILLSGPTPIPPPATLTINRIGDGAQMSWTSGKRIQVQSGGVWSDVAAGPTTAPVPPTGTNLRII